VHLGLVNSALDGLSGAGVNTLAKLQAIVDAAGGVLAYVAGQGTVPSLASLQSLGLTGITAENVAALQNAMASSAADGSGVATVAQLQGLLVSAKNSADAALSAVQNYTGSNTAPTAATYAELGIAASEVNALNTWLPQLTAAQKDSIAEIQGVASAFTALQAQQSLSQAQLEALGVTGLNAASAPLLASVIQASGSVLPQSLQSLQSLANVSVAVTRLADGFANNGTALSAAQLAQLGVVGATDGNLMALVNSALDALSPSSVNTVQKLQLVVEAANRVLAHPAGQVAPSLNDFQALGLDAVNLGNLAAL